MNRLLKVVVWGIVIWGLTLPWLEFNRFLMSPVLFGLLVGTGPAYFLGQRWQKINYPLGKFAIINGLIFAGVLFATYSEPQSAQLGVFIWKSFWVALFGVVVYIWLIKPNLTLLKGN